MQVVAHAQSRPNSPAPGTRQVPAIKHAAPPSAPDQPPGSRLWQAWRGAQHALSNALANYGTGRPTDPLVYVTSHPLKAKDMTAIFQSTHFSTVDLQLPTTLESSSIEEVATYRVRLAYAELRRRNGGVGQPVFLDESEMVLDNPQWPGRYPGIQIKYLLKHQGGEAFAKQHQGCGGEVRVVFAYTRDGKDVVLSSGAISGSVVYPLRRGDGSEGIDYMGWDAFWLPRHAQQTLAESHRYRHTMTHRQFGGFELRSYLFGKEFPGVYELHVTVQEPPRELNEDDTTYTLRLHDFVDHFKATCLTLDQVGLSIANVANGVSYPQIQTKRFYTFRHGTGEAVREAFRIGDALRSHGFTPVRHRAEAMFFNPDAPNKDSDASADLYFEMHLRVMGPTRQPLTAAELQNLQAIAATHGALISTVGSHYFINQRYFGVGRQTAGPKWYALQRAVVDSGFAIKTNPLEYVMYDDAPERDATWTAPHAEAAAAHIPGMKPPGDLQAAPLAKRARHAAPGPSRQPSASSSPAQTAA